MAYKPFNMWAFFFNDSGKQGHHGQLARIWIELNEDHVIEHYCLPTRINTLQLQFPTSRMPSLKSLNFQEL